MNCAIKGTVEFMRFFVVLLCTLTCPAYAQSDQAWGEVGRWTIRIDPDAGNGCFMESSLEDGTLVQFGLVPNRSGGFFSIYNKNWQDIVAGDELPVTLEFDAKQFSGDAAGSELGELRGGYAYFNNPNVFDEFSRSKTMIIHGGDGRDIPVDLTGTAKAMQSVRACQKQQGE